MASISFTSLPADVLEAIAVKLDGDEIMSTFGVLNKKCNMVTHSERLWRSIIEAELAPDVCTRLRRALPADSWRELYSKVSRWSAWRALLSYYESTRMPDEVYHDNPPEREIDFRFIAKCLGRLRQVPVRDDDSDRSASSSLLGNGSFRSCILLDSKLMEAVVQMALDQSSRKDRNWICQLMMDGEAFSVFEGAMNRPNMDANFALERVVYDLGFASPRVHTELPRKALLLLCSALGYLIWNSTILPTPNKVVLILSVAWVVLTSSLLASRPLDLLFGPAAGAAFLTTQLPVLSSLGASLLAFPSIFFLLPKPDRFIWGISLALGCVVRVLTGAPPQGPPVISFLPKLALGLTNLITIPAMMMTLVPIYWRVWLVGPRLTVLLGTSFLFKSINFLFPTFEPVNVIKWAFEKKLIEAAPQGLVLALSVLPRTSFRSIWNKCVDWEKFRKLSIGLTVWGIGVGAAAALVLTPFFYEKGFVKFWSH